MEYKDHKIEKVGGIQTRTSYSTVLDHGNYKVQYTSPDLDDVKLKIDNHLEWEGK